MPNPRRIFLIGGAGTGMQGLAHILAAKGNLIAATDTNFPELTRVAATTFEIVPEEAALPLLKKSDLVIYSDAVPAAHPLRRAAQKNNHTVLGYHEAVGQLSQKYTTIAITGTHGKSSTTALLGFIAAEAGLDPTVLLGAPMPAWNGAHARAGNSSLFIVEADEYRDHFLALAPTYGVITSIDFDHPDYFDSPAAVMQSYQRFIDNIPPAGAIITHLSTKTTAPTLIWPAHTVFVQNEIKVFLAALPGRHMQDNAQLAIAAAARIGVAPEDAIRILQRFPGLGRRFETIGQLDALTVISDYGHHPAEIAVTARAARERYPTQKILLMLEPHTDARLQTFFDEFVDVLTKAPVDGITICPTFYVEGREKKPIDSSEALYRSVQMGTAKSIERLSAYTDVSAVLVAASQHYDILLAFTAGRLDSALRTALLKHPAI